MTPVPIKEIRPMSATVTPSTTTTTWQIDPTHSHVEFAVKHLMIATVKGRFADVQGSVVANDDNPADAKIDVTIAAASIDTRQEQRDAHLRSPDFLDVEQFPTITFRSKRIEAQKGDNSRVVGDLTIRGTTREVVLDVEHTGRARDPWGNDRAAFSATTKVNRKEFGLTWNQALEAGGVLVGDDLRISIDVELVKQAAQA
jgi:polyisoprenoid-binding protein YceI